MTSLLNRYYALYSLLRNNRARRIAVQSARALGVRHLVVRFDTNFLCNLRCKTCYFSGPNAREMRRRALTTEEFRAIGNTVFPKTRLLFLSCGGEPLMSRDFPRFLEVAAEYRIPYVGFVTNALLFRDETIETAIDTRVNEITISTDGATRATYEMIREGGKFRVLLDKLERLADAKRARRATWLQLRFNFTITRANFREMVDLIELARRYDVATVKLRHFTDWGGAFTFREQSLQGLEAEFNEVLARTCQRARELGIVLLRPQPFALGSRKKTLPSLPVETLAARATRPACLMPWYHLYIDPEGKTRPCSFLPVSEETLLETSLESIDASPIARMRREKLLRDPLHSCLVDGCRGQIIRRANEESDNLAQYDESGLVSRTSS